MTAKPDGEPPAGSAVNAARILIVEDNALNRLLSHDILELRGHEVVEAATVDEARRALDRAAPTSCCWTSRFRAAAPRR